MCRELGGLDVGWRAVGFRLWYFAPATRRYAAAFSLPTALEGMPPYLL